MIWDSFFRQGTTHAVCEDYALAIGNTGVVCDGCSSSLNTDLGARLVALAALSGDPTDLGAFVQGIAQPVQPFVQASLDATCLRIQFLPGELDSDNICSASRIVCTAWGDGYFLFRQEEAWNIIRLEMPHGAPPYPSYLLNPARLRTYRQMTDGGECLVTRFTFREGALTEGETATHIFAPVEGGLTPFEFSLPETVDFVLAFSDGLGTAHIVGPGSPSREMPFEALIREVTAFKYDGEGLLAPGFLKRRLQRLFRPSAGEHVVHYDDLSGVALFLRGAR